MKTFIGQKLIVNELNKIIRSHPQFISILFKAQAGMGKTLLATEFLDILCKKQYRKQIISHRDNYRFIWKAGMERIKGHFIDEIHVCKNFEDIYPVLDRRQNYFIFATNQYAKLPDAFVTRCITYHFDDYTVEELAQLIKYYSLVTKRITLPQARILAEKSRGNPRRAKQLLERICILSGTNNIGNISSLCKDIGIYDGGYTLLDIKYLRFLKEKGCASLSTISRGLDIDIYTITDEIEPFLIRNGHIEITSRGRKFISIKQQNGDEEWI